MFIIIVMCIIVMCFCISTLDIQRNPIIGKLVSLQERLA